MSHNDNVGGRCCRKCKYPVAYLSDRKLRELEVGGVQELRGQVAELDPVGHLQPTQSETGYGRVLSRAVMCLDS